MSTAVSKWMCALLVRDRATLAGRGAYNTILCLFSFPLPSSISNR